jgi:hypothetical protein
VVVSVLATESNGRGFKPGRGDGFLRAIKIRSTLSFGWEVKPEARELWWSIHEISSVGIIISPWFSHAHITPGG